MEAIPLAPVDALTVTTLVDNVADLLLTDRGPAKAGPVRARRRDRPADADPRRRPGHRRPARRARLLVSGECARERPHDPRPVRRRAHARRPGRETCAGSSSRLATSTSSCSATGAGTLLDGSLLVTGEIDRTTDYPLFEAYRDGHWQPDPLILDDQALVANVRGKGLVVLTGCGHSGIVNILHHVRKLTGEDRIHAVIGGFHLSGPLFERIIAPTCDALAELAPDHLVPCHCTGWRAIHAIARTFPDAFIQRQLRLGRGAGMPPWSAVLGAFPSICDAKAPSAGRLAL